MAARKYQKYTQHQHILELPDTYIGSTKTNEETRWAYDAGSNKMVWRKLMFNPGLYKIFDEIVVNARDEYVRSTVTAGMTAIKHIDVTVQSRDGDTVISVENDGDGIPIEMNEQEKMMVPEMIFGNLLTSSNYDKSEAKIVGGKNGLGSKAANIMSKLFTIDIKTPASGKQYTQSWYDNMYRVEKPIIKKSTSKTGHVNVTFIPDKTRFLGAFDDTGITGDMIQCFHTRIIELAALVGKDVKVTWNGVAVASNTFEKFIKLFLRDGMTGSAYEHCGPRWEVGAILASHLYSDEEELPEDKHISFVNGIHTKKGGKHVETVGRKVLADFCELANKKKVDIKPGQLKNSIVLFINSTIVNPSFDSQSKEYLSTPAAEFGSKPEYSGKLVDGLAKLGLLEEAKFLLEAKSLRETKKTDGKKRSTIRGMTKLEDAMLAGTAKSSLCTLILTEGDSAATSAISGLKEVGRELWGVFPLRGKLLNVRDITVQKFNANEELTAIKKILGL